MFPDQFPDAVRKHPNKGKGSVYSAHGSMLQSVMMETSQHQEAEGTGQMVLQSVSQEAGTFVLRSLLPLCTT